MAEHPARAVKTSLASFVMDRLGRSIVSGELAPGSIIDVDGLETTLGVSRTVVREAIKVLTSKGLVGARPKFGTYVQERDRWNLLDAEVMAWRDTERPDPELLRDLDELRRVLEPAAARLAAQRRTEEQAEVLRQAVGMISAGDIDEHVEADLLFHRTVLEATGNELLGRLDVVLRMALRIRDRLTYSSPHSDEYLDHHASVAAAIGRGDPDAAEQAMHGLLDAAVRDAAAITAGKKRRKR